MPLQATAGAATYDAFGGGVTAANYIEDIFQTWLYTGNGSTQTITNGVDLAGKGGLVWLKDRTSALANQLFDTARGTTKVLTSNTSGSQDTESTSLTAFNSNGFSLDSYLRVNGSDDNYASWTFRKQPKFFDVVTYTGNNSVRRISHNLGSVPGCIIVKEYTAGSSNWWVYHRSLGINTGIFLDLTSGSTTYSGAWGTSDPTSTDFGLGSGFTNNVDNAQHVAYLFAHDAGGFGASGTDNVISCGSFTTDGSGFVPDVNLGYEPQFLLIKQTNAANNWYLFDTMRGYSQTSANYLQAQSSAAEITNWPVPYFGVLTATGFKGTVSSGINNGTFIYIAIRRGPMRTPTTGTSVFTPLALNNATDTSNTTGFPIDMQIASYRASSGNNKWLNDRLRGVNSVGVTGNVSYLIPNATNAETLNISATRGWSNTGFNTVPNFGVVSTAYWNFQRAPGFFDVVCYTGTGGTGSRSLSHNLQAVPELIILKRRDAVANWQTGSMFTSTTVTRAVLNRNDDQDLNSLYTGQSIWGGQPTTSAFLIDAGGSFNTNAGTYVAYLFATVAGVSKIGSYTGTGTTLQVDCGFTGGARFVLIKRTDSTGDWYVWDSARGIVAGNDPYLILNSTAAEVTSTDYVDTFSSGFEISSTAPAAINANGGTFVFLAVA